MTTALIRTSAIAVLLSAFLISAYVVSAVDSTTSAKTRGQKVQERIETRQENIQDRVDTRKETLAQRVEDRKENIASREAALKAKLNSFRNKQKAQIVERLNNELNNINKKMILHFQRVLEVMSTILNKLEARVNSSTPDIKDPTLAKEAINDAKLTIASANAAVSAQAAKDYTVSLTTEARAKTDLQTVRKQLHDDLKVVHQSVADAKKSVARAIRIAKSGKLEPIEEATPSGQQQ